METFQKQNEKGVNPGIHTLMRHDDDDDMMHQACEDDELRLKSKLPNPKSMIELEEAQNKAWLDANKSRERRRRRTKTCGGSCCKDHDNASNLLTGVSGAMGAPTEESADETRTKAKTLSGLYALTVQQRVEAIREALKVELELNDAKKGANIENGRVLTPQKPVNVVSKQKSQDTGGWQLLSIIIDSGAAETVIPYKQIKGYKVQETEDSKEGRCYTSATGDPIPNMGEQVLPLQTLEGTLRSMRFQAAPVERPLGSVMRICAAGHRVVFDADEGSYILNKESGELNWLREDNGNYVMDTWVPPPSDIMGYAADHAEADFRGPP